ncbi:unnamed protein product [Clonostachys rosea]|uniref:lytic cellulose monooxygenase (C4-dehydrogenating) n=1 Tax=Bionectria ochroleuca TaxID=29856 RepID=A0ABY6UVY4_BIOOC|nr:unnamed protein product [Clonostachys rosea]
MKFILVLSALSHVASAHYFFGKLISNGVATEKYVRKSTRPTAYNPIKFSSNPAADLRDGSTIDGPDARCNQGAFTNAASTEVISVAAGSEVRVQLGVSATMQHPGPGLVYMSRAPDDNVKAYDGSGDWFKIFEEGVCSQSADFTKDAWCTYDRNWLAATIPADTPSGEYLVRFEHIGIHRSHVNQPEHYVSCVQVKVTGGGSGNPSPTVKFPGAYADTDDYANFSIYNGYKAFTMPGPAVWAGGNSGSGTDETDAPASSVTPVPLTSETPVPVASETPVPSSGEGCAARFGQCGGKAFDGANCCATGECKELNQWYSQCI